MATVTGYNKAQADTLLAAKAPLASPAFTGSPTIGGVAAAKTTDITAAIAALVNGASTALDTLSEIDAQIAADEGSAAALATLVASKAALLTVQANRTANATLAVDTVNPFDATTAPLTGTLPTPTKAGQVITVEKVDASANLVTIAGTLRGVVGSMTLSTQYESIFLVAEPSLTSWRPIAGHKTKTALDATYQAYAAQFPAAGNLVPVASGTISGNGTSSMGSDTLRSWITKHTFLVDTPFIELEFVNWYPNGGGDSDGPTAYTLRVGYDPNGPSNGTGIFPVKWNGADTIVVNPGATVRSDPIFVDGRAGTTFWIRETATPASGNTYVFTGLADPNAGYAFGPVQDNSRSGTNYAGGPNQAVAPAAILGFPSTPVRRAVALIGDSIMQGANGYPSSYVGGFEQALTTQRVPFVKIPKGGESAGTFAVLAYSSRRLALAAGCTDAIVQYGTNDLVAGTTAATIEASLTTIYQRLARMGVKRIWQTTITPRSTSTDGWITATNQTPVAGFGPGSAQATLNAWIRAGGGGLLAGYIDVDAALSSSVGSGVWAAARKVTDLVATSGNATVTSATAAFTQNDVGAWVSIPGIGASGATYNGTIASITNATTAVLSQNAATAVSGGTAYINVPTQDGVHPNQPGHNAIAAIIPTFTG